MSSVTSSNGVVNTTLDAPECQHPEHMALATAWYADNPEFGGDAELLGYAADQIGFYLQHEGRMPREAAEVDAWSNSTEQYAEYLAAHPVPQQAAPTPDEAKARAAKALAEVEAEEEAVRASVKKATQQMVKSLQQGERALCRDYLDAGMYAHRVVVGKLRLTEKRDHVLKVVDGLLAQHSGIEVDANRLIKCWAAYDLLVTGQGLEKDAVDVVYTKYRSAWALLVQRVVDKRADGFITGEHYVLLPGVEDLCRAHFKRCTLDGLSTEACIDWAKVCQREQLMVETKAKALAEEQAKAVRIKAEQDAALARKQTQEAAAAKQATQAAAEKANAEAAAAQQAAVQLAAASEAAKAAPTTTGQTPEQQQAAQEEAAAAEEAAQEAKQEADRLALEAKAKQEQAVAARLAAEAKAKADEKARLDAELAAKQADRAKAEARVASERQATAEAKKAELDRKAAEREANKGSRTAKAKPAGVNLVPTPKDASPKDVAEWMVKSMLANSNPDAVFLELLALLVNAPTESPVAAFKHEGVQDAIMAAAWSLQDSLDKADAAAKAKQEQGKSVEQAEEPSDAELAKLEAAGVA